MHTGVLGTAKRTVRERQGQEEGLTESQARPEALGPLRFAAASTEPRKGSEQIFGGWDLDHHR